MQITKIETNQPTSIVNVKPAHIYYDNGTVNTLNEKVMTEYEWTYQFINMYCRPFNNIKNILDLQFKGDGNDIRSVPEQLRIFIMEEYQGILKKVDNEFCDTEELKQNAMSKLISYCINNRIDPKSMRLPTAVYSLHIPQHEKIVKY